MAVRRIILTDEAVFGRLVSLPDFVRQLLNHFNL